MLRARSVAVQCVRASSIAAFRCPHGAEAVSVAIRRLSEKTNTTSEHADDAATSLSRLAELAEDDAGGVLYGSAERQVKAASLEEHVWIGKVL